jgi:hypothetical protein
MEAAMNQKQAVRELAGTDLDDAQLNKRSITLLGIP